MTEHGTPQQLSLVPAPDVPVRFLIDARTRERGIRHIAAIRAQLAERRLQRAAADRADQRPAA